MPILKDKDSVFYAIPTITLEQIWGFTIGLKESDPFVMPVHPDYPNPRTTYSPQSKDIIAAIAETGELLEPIKVAALSGTDKYLLVDGYTRLTGLGRYLTNKGIDPADFPIPYIPVSLTDNELRAYMARVNYDRVNLDDVMVGEFLVYLDNKGVPEDEQASLLGRNNRGGKRWIRAMKQVVASTSLRSAVKSGAVSSETARSIATKETTEKARAAMTKKVEAALDDAKKKEAKKAAKAPVSNRKTTAKTSKELEKTAAQQVGARRTNMTTLGVKEVFALIERIYVQWKTTLHNDSVHGAYDDIDWGDVPQRQSYHEALEIHAAMETLFTVMKISDKTLEEQIAWVEARLSKETLASIPAELTGSTWLGGV